MAKSIHPDEEKHLPGESRPSESAHQENSGGEVFAFPLSRAQERMWIDDRAAPGSSVYNASFRWSLSGPLDSVILQNSLNEIIRRHEILRATFVQDGDGPIQLIAPTLAIQVNTTDLRSLPANLREEEMDRLSAEEARRSFDVKKGPLVRAGLIRMEDQNYVLTFTLHHLVSDGWSIGIIMEELQKIYSALAGGNKPALPHLGIQYPDYVVWQREQLAGPEIAQQLAYWKKKLSGYTPLEVPTDFQRPVRPTTNSAIVSTMLPRELTGALKDLSNRQGGTLFITSLAALLTVLHRYTGESDLSVGSPLAGRNRADLENLVGLFINPAIFRVGVSGDPLFPDFANQVRDTVWETFANQDVPFSNVMEELHPSHPNDGRPYAINFICQREYARASTFIFEFAGICMSTMPSMSQGALYELNFFMVEREAGWRLSLEYNTDLYKETTASRMLKDFRELLEAVASNPNQRLSQFSPGGISLSHDPGSAAKDRLSPSESASLPALDPSGQIQNAASEKYILPASLTQQRFWLLDKIAPGNPEFHMPACVHIAGTLSDSLLTRSFQFLVAHHEALRTTFEEEKGELIQVIAAAREFSLPVSALEEIDPEMRPDALKEMIRKEARSPFDLKYGPLMRARLFRLSPEEHVLVITIHHILADGWSQNVLQRDLWSAYEALRDNKQISLPALTIHYGDFAHWQKEWLASEDAAGELDFWTTRLAGRLPVLDFPTDRSTRRHFASEGAIETVLLDRDLVQSLKSFGQSQEATMFTVMLACFGILLSRYAGSEDILIGSPVANRKSETEGLIGPFSGPVCLRLDLSGNPTLEELVRGVREVVLDALSHTDLPFEALLERLDTRSVHGRSPIFQFYFFYQTAFLQPRQLKDLIVKPLPTMSFGTPFEMQLGLVERSEGIRAQLEYNPELFDATTMQEVLRFYEKVLRALVEKPTSHMKDIPAPARANDPARLQPADDTKREYIGPRTSAEMQLALIWEKLLGGHAISVRDDFFDLGGQSLLAAQMIREVETAFNRKIDLSTLMTAPTIEQLALYLKGQEISQDSSLVPIRPLGSKPPLFCVHGGGGHVLRFRAMAARLDADQPFYGLRSPEVDGAMKQVTVEELAARYVQDVFSVQPRGPYYLCGSSFGGLVAYEMAAQIAEKGQEIAFLGLLDTGNPAHYRNLQFSQSIQFKCLYVLERFEKYGKRLLKGQFGEFFQDAAGSIRARGSNMLWKVAQRVYRKRNRPLPVGLRDNVKLFEAAGEAYNPRSYPGRVVLFRAAGRTAEYGSDPALGWDKVIQGGIEILTVPGDHMTILEEPYVWNLVKQLNVCLEQARTRN